MNWQPTAPSDLVRSQSELHEWEMRERYKEFEPMRPKRQQQVKEKLTFRDIVILICFFSLLTVLAVSIISEWVR